MNGEPQDTSDGQQICPGVNQTLRRPYRYENASKNQCDFHPDGNRRGPNVGDAVGIL